MPIIQEAHPDLGSQRSFIFSDLVDIIYKCHSSAPQTDLLPQYTASYAVTNRPAHQNTHKQLGKLTRHGRGYKSDPFLVRVSHDM